MERADFIERITNRQLLQHDAATDWAALTEKYPYASLVQLLNFQSKKEATDKHQQALRLHFENPIHFNKVLNGLSPNVISSELARKERMAEMEALLKEKKAESNKIAEQAALNATVSKKKTVRLPKEKIAKAPEPEVVEKEIVAEVKKEEIAAKEIAAQTPESNEDVLELINELPEENPIKKAQAEMPIAEEAAETEKVAESEDPQDLMVMMSFTDWLQFFKAKKENEEEDKKGRDAIRSAWQKEKLAEAMDDEEDVVPDEIFEKAMKSVSFSDNLVTEPLAELYVKQEKIDKAIELYKKLSLLNPEKRAYFAAKIKNLHL